MRLWLTSSGLITEGTFFKRLLNIESVQIARCMALVTRWSLEIKSQQ